LLLLVLVVFVALVLLFLFWLGSILNSLFGLLYFFSLLLVDKVSTVSLGSCGTHFSLVSIFLQFSSFFLLLLLLKLELPLLILYFVLLESEFPLLLSGFAFLFVLQFLLFLPPSPDGIEQLLLPLHGFLLFGLGGLPLVGRDILVLLFDLEQLQVLVDLLLVEVEVNAYLLDIFPL
jgi:hypothetical protein